MTAMELDDILKFERLICTGDTSRAGWVLDQDAVIEAMDTLGITYPVKIRFMTGKYRFGTHYENAESHRITIHQGLSAEEASHTLWHELAHAMQAERYMKERNAPNLKGFYTEYKRGRGEWGETYRGNIYEIEAERIADANSDRTLVVRR